MNGKSENPGKTTTVESGWGNGIVPVRPIPTVNADSLREHVQQSKARPPVRKVIENAITAWERIAQSGLLTESDLNLVVVAATNSQGLCWGAGGQLLGNLAGIHPEAREAVRSVMRSGTATQRWHFLNAGMRYCGDQALRREVLSAALNDRAASVRVCAAAACDRLCMTELITDLETRLSIESDTQVRVELERAIGMLRDGYFAKPDKQDPEHWWVMVRFATDLYAGDLGADCTSEDIKSGKVREIAAQARLSRTTLRPR